MGRPPGWGVRDLAAPSLPVDVAGGGGPVRLRVVADEHLHRSSKERHREHPELAAKGDAIAAG